MDPRGPADHQPNDPTMARPAGPPPQWGSTPPPQGGWGPPPGGGYPPAGGGYPPGGGGYPPGGWGPPPGQGQPYPPTGSYPTGPQRNNKKWWFFGAGALLVAIAVVIAIAVIPGGDSTNTAETSSMRTITTTSGANDTSTRRTTTTTPTTTTVANVDPNALPGLFLDTNTVGSAMQISGMVADPVDTNLISGTFSPEGCGSIYGVTYEPAYAGSGFTAVARQTIRQEPKGPNAFVQGLVAFPDEAAAKARYTQMMLDWDKCEGVQFDAEIGGQNVTLKSGTVLDMEGTASLLLFNRVNLDTPGADATDCERAISARKNVIVDVLACTVNQGNTGRQLARDIGEKITGAR